MCRPSADCEDVRSWRSDEVQLIYQKRVPPIPPSIPVDTSALDRHRALGNVGDVVALRGATQILPDGEVRARYAERKPGLTWMLSGIFPSLWGLQSRSGILSGSLRAGRRP